MRQRVQRLHCARRGCRAGKRVYQRTARVTVNETVTPGEIPTVSTKLSFQNLSSSVHASPFRVLESRASALLTVRRHGLHDLIRVGLFNARSVSNKSASIQDWITSTRLNVAALVETWHDDAASPDLIACAPPGFKFVETARTRKNHCSLSTNHGGVCVLYDSSLHARTVQLPVFSTFEVVAAYVIRAGFNAVFVAVYRPGSVNVTQSFMMILTIC